MCFLPLGNSLGLCYNLAVNTFRRKYFLLTHISKEFQYIRNILKNPTNAIFCVAGEILWPMAVITMCSFSLRTQYIQTERKFELN